MDDGYVPGLDTLEVRVQTCVYLSCKHVCTSRANVCAPLVHACVRSNAEGHFFYPSLFLLHLPMA